MQVLMALFSFVIVDNIQGQHYVCMCVCFNTNCYSGSASFFLVALARNTSFPQKYREAADPAGPRVLRVTLMYQGFQLYSWTQYRSDVAISRYVIKTQSITGMIFFQNIGYQLPVFPSMEERKSNKVMRKRLLPRQGVSLGFIVHRSLYFLD